MLTDVNNWRTFSITSRYNKVTSALFAEATAKALTSASDEPVTRLPTLLRLMSCGKRQLRDRLYSSSYAGVMSLRHSTYASCPCRL